MAKQSVRANPATLPEQARATLYPIIEDIIASNTSSNEPYISRDDIATHLINREVSRQIIVSSIKEEFQNDEDVIWGKAANYVDFLNRDITAVAPLSRKWNDGFYVRKQLSRRHPITKALGKTYFMAISNSTIENDTEEMISRIELAKAGIEKTEKIQLLKARIGQGAFREYLIDYWQGCAVTKCKEIGLLRASHIKPWRYSDDFERLDPFNGLLLIPNLDAAFDKGYISFDDQGRILISPCLDEKEISILGINQEMRVRASLIHIKHRVYLKYHRDNRFKK